MAFIKNRLYSLVFTNNYGSISSQETSFVGFMKFFNLSYIYCRPNISSGPLSFGLSSFQLNEKPEASSKSRLVISTFFIRDCLEARTELGRSKVKSKSNFSIIRLHLKCPSIKLVDGNEKRQKRNNKNKNRRRAFIFLHLRYFKRVKQ